MAVIFNSSPLINLSRIGKLQIIEDLFKSVMVPRAVYEEVIENAPEHDCFLKELQGLFSRDIIQVTEVKNTNLVRALTMDIDYGESEVIALALEINAELIVLDEVDARKVAEVYNLKKTGFIGLLIRAEKEGILKDSVKDLIDEAIDSGFWVSKELYNAIIYQLEH